MNSQSFAKSLEGFLTRLDAVHTDVMVHTGTLKSLKNQQIGLQNEVAALHTEVELLEKVNETLLHLIAVTSASYSSKIENLVTGGLQAVFSDLDLVFIIEITKRRNTSAVEFKLHNSGIEFPLMRGTGGGVLAVIGVLLRVITIILLDMKRVLFLDETLVHVSEKYIENVSALLKKLCSDLDFSILLVTHQKEFVTHADHHYAVNDSHTGITFKQIK